MDGLILATQSSDTKSKLASLEQLLEKLQRSPTLADVSNDVKFRLMSNCANLMKDANPKVAMTALDVVEICINNSFAVFQPLSNMAFDLLIAKFGDIKLATRTRATDTMIALINAVGLSTALEKLLPHLSHRVWRVREQVLAVLLRVVQVYGEDTLAAPDLPRQLSALLADPQSSVRQLTMDVLCDLYSVFGESMMADLEAAGTRPSQIKLIQQTIDSRGGRSRDTPSSDAGSIDIPSENERHPTSNRTPRGLSSTSRPRSSSRGPATGAPNLTRAISEPLEDRPIKSSQPRASGVGGFGRAAALGATAPIRSSTQGGRETSDASPKEFNPNTPSSVARKFSPDYFLSILGDGPSLSRNTGLVLYTERDLAGECGAIVEGLMKPSDHWEDRMAALERLQVLVCMDAADFDTFPSLLKGMHEQVSIQVTDLRSTVSKEGCRTVAILANRMGNAFAPFAELWFPTLLKVISVKISVISSAADRAARTVLYSMTSGAPRAVPILTECCAAKNPIIRKFGFEYCCIAFARWKQEYFDKHFGGFLKILTSGIGDADPGVRKGARLLYWVIHARGGSWKTAMTNLIKDLDSNAQRHVRSEENSASDDLADLFRKPDTCFPVDNYYTCGSNVSSTPPLVATTSDKSTISKSGTTRAAPEKLVTSVNNTKEKPRAVSDSKASEPVPTSVANTPASGAMGLPVRVNSASAKSSASAPLAFSGDQPDNMAPPVMSLAAAREIRENRTGSRRLSVATCSSGGLSSADRGIGSKDAGTPSNAAPLSGSRRMSIGPSSSANRSAPISGAEKELTSALTNGPKRIVRQGFSASQKNPAGSSVVDQSATFAEVKESAVRKNRMYESRQGILGGSANVGPSEVNAGPSADCDSATDDGSSIDLSVPDDNENDVTTANSSLHELRQMTADPLWDIRLKALLEIKRRVGQAFPPYYYKDGVFLGPAAKKNRKASDATAVDGSFGKQLATEYVEGIVDLTLAKIGDPHNRVAMTALDCIYLIVFPMEVKQSNVHDGSNAYVVSPVLEASSALAKLGYMMPALFARLADRRSKIRDRANEILNNIKASYDPNILIAALSPRLCEVSDRVRTAVVQFLLTIAALCEAFFRSPSNTHIFLSRMAHLMGSGGAMTPSTSFLLTGKRLLELVYKTTPQVMLSQIAGLPLQEQVTIKKNLSALVPNIDGAVAAASKVEWNRMNSSDGGVVRNTVSSRESQSKSPAFPIANLDTTTDSDVCRSPSTRNSAKSGSRSPNGYLSPHALDRDDSVILDEAEPVEDINDISESSMYAPIDDDIGFVEERFVPTQDAVRSPNVMADAKVSPSRGESSGVLPLSPKVFVGQPVSPVESKPSPSSTPSSGSRKTPSSPDVTSSRNSPHVSAITSPHLVESRDIVWLLRTLSGTEFLLNVDERKDAIAELKTLIKQGTDAFWSRNFAQIISVLLDAFSPVTNSERSVSAAAASGAEEYAFLAETVNSITGLSPPNLNMNARLSRGQSGTADGGGSMSKAHANDRSPFESQMENLSASEYNNVRENRPNRAESKSPDPFDGGEEQVLRMEFLHNVCRALLLIVRHRSRDAKNFLELMTCRLCEAAAYLPLALTMQCEQILGMACPLGAQGMAKALAPYCSYGNGSVSVAGAGDETSSARLPPPPDPSFASSPTSAVRRLALRVLALCVPNMTSRELISILPLLMTHILPSFRSPLVDIRQAVVGAIVQMYVLVGDVLHPYVKELPPQQKKLLTIYIDRQLKSKGSNNITSSTVA